VSANLDVALTHADLARMMRDLPVKDQSTHEERPRWHARRPLHPLAAQRVGRDENDRPRLRGHHRPDEPCARRPRGVRGIGRRPPRRDRPLGRPRAAHAPEGDVGRSGVLGVGRGRRAHRAFACVEDQAPTGTQEGCPTAVAERASVAAARSQESARPARTVLPAGAGDAPRRTLRPADQRLRFGDRLGAPVRQGPEGTHPAAARADPRRAPLDARERSAARRTAAAARRLPALPDRPPRRWQGLRGSDDLHASSGDRRTARARSRSIAGGTATRRPQGLSAPA
jgi:hypothetical protein